METFTKKIILRVLIASVFLIGSAKASAYPCEKFLTKVRQSWVAPRIFAPREKRSLLDRLRKRPKSERKLSKWITLPASLVAVVGVFGYFDYKAVQYNIEGFTSAVEQNWDGAETMVEWINTKGLEPDAAREFYSHFQTDYQNRLEPLRKRRDDFVRLGWWNAQAGQLARKIMDELVQKNTLRDLRKKDELLNKIQNHPDFPELAKQVGAQYLFSLDLWLTPEVTYLGRTDLDWIQILFDKTPNPEFTQQQKQGLESIREFYDKYRENMSYVALVEITAQTIKNTSDIETKLAKAKALNLPVERPTFSRVDFPLFADEVTFHDNAHGDTVMKDELDRWNLLLKDPRFQNIAKAWRQNKIDDFDALLRFEMQWRQIAKADLRR